MVSRVKLAVGTRSVQRASTVTQGNFSLTFDRDVLYCETEDGIICVHSNGASIIDYAPGETTLDGELTQRFSKNPAVNFKAAGQGVDARVASYSAGKVTSLPHAPNPGDSVILQEAAELIGGSLRKGSASAWAGFQFTDALPTSGRFAGPLGYWNLKTVTTYEIDLDAKVASLPSLSMSGVDYPAVTDVIERLDRFLGLTLVSPADPTVGYEAWPPQAVMAGLYESNYGQYFSVLTNAAGLHLIGNVATTGQKRTLLRRLIQIGLQIFEGSRAIGHTMGQADGNGGHYQWEFIPILCYLWSRDLGDDLDDLRRTTPTNVLAQAFYWTSGQIAQLAPHSNIGNICISRRRTITAVDGTRIRYTVSNSYDPGRFGTRNLIMTRESDGATAVVVSVDDTQTGPGYHDVTIDAQPGAAFEVDDVIYFQSPYEITEGDVDWRIGGQDNLISPSPHQDYRDLNFWMPQILFGHAIGVWRSDWDATKDYVLRANQSNEPAGHDFPAHWAPRTKYGEYQFDRAMWDAHAASYGLVA